MSDEDGPRLVMPFVVVQSKGGPYDDDAFVAGYLVGQIWAGLAMAKRDGRTDPVEFLVYRNLVEQVDLVAAQHGFVTSEGRWPDDVVEQSPEAAAEWVMVQFTPAAPIPADPAEWSADHDG